MFLLLGWFSSVWRIAAGVRPKEQKEVPEPNPVQVEDILSVQPVLALNHIFQVQKAHNLECDSFSNETFHISHGEVKKLRVGPTAIIYGNYI